MPFVRITVHMRPDQETHKGQLRANVVDEFVVPEGFDGDWEAFTRAQDAITLAQKKYKEMMEMIGGNSANTLSVS